MILLAAATIAFFAAPPSLADEIEAAIQPILLNLSYSKSGWGFTNASWAFAYRDEETTVELCAGFADKLRQTPCNAVNDSYAWGSTTKTMTSLAVLRLVEQGKIPSIDDSIVTHANDYLRNISNGTSDFVEIFGPDIHNVTIRHLLSMHSGIRDYDNGDTRSYQNKHKELDISPLWILNLPNIKQFEFFPGTRAHYSSTNYVILGLVLANYQQASNWDKMNQREWVPKKNEFSSNFNSIKYGIHGKCKNFSGWDNVYDGQSIHGYQNVKDSMLPATINQSDVYNISVLQGWTCGNMVAKPVDIAEFFWTLLGPGRNDSSPLLGDAMLAQMLDFKNGSYFDGQAPYEYGLGMMNFSTMHDWGFDREGLFYGHNGLTYGFGAQSGYNYKHQFAVTWVNNNERWVGPDQHGQPDELYTTLVNVVETYRKKQQAQMQMLE